MRRISGWLFAILAPIVAVVVVYGGIRWLDWRARRELRHDERFKMAFASIKCEAPPGMKLEDFLVEVQYLATLPDQLEVLDRRLVSRLGAAFERHPWVEKVDRIERNKIGGIDVQLTYRTPVLAVPWNDTLRAVDAEGILLPTSASTEGLPVYRGKADPPSAPAGGRWDDNRIRASAAVVRLLREGQEHLHLVAVEIASTGLVLVAEGGARVIWGQPPGAEDEGESTSAQKKEFLLTYGDLAQPRSAELDLRFID